MLKHQCHPHIRLKVIVLALSVMLPAFSQQINLKLDPKQSKINFVLGDVLHTVHGFFSLTKGDLWFDPDANTAGGLLEVSAASGDSGSHARDSRMQKNILQAELYPTVTFKPDRLEGKVNLSGDSEFQLHGKFGIHGALHELTMHVKAHFAGDSVTTSAQFDVPYVQWGMKNPSTFLLHVNDVVQIEVQGVGRITSGL